MSEHDLHGGPLLDLFSEERMTTEEELIEDQAERIDVRRRARALALADLRRHIGWRA